MSDKIQLDQYKAYIADISEFKPDPKNHNKHKLKGHKMVTNSMQNRGYARPGFAANDGTVLGGNLSTMEIAPSLGIGDGKVLVVETDGDIPIIHKRRDVSPDSLEARQLSYEDNLTGIFSFELDAEVVSWDIANGFDFEAINVNLSDLSVMLEGAADSLLGGDGNPTQDEEVDQTEAEKYQAIWKVQPGDVWQLGDHRIACLDSLDEEAVKAVIGGDSVGMVWADPPYGIDAVDTDRKTLNSGNPYPFGGLKKVTGTDGSGHLIPANRYAPVIGDATTETAKRAIEIYLGSFGEAVHIWWGANHYSDSLPASPCWVVWDKRDDLPSNDFADGEMAWVKSSLAIRIFRHRWSGLVKASEHNQKRVHPTQKPIELARWCFEKYGKLGDLIIDPFLGSGISVLAAESLGDRRVTGFELAPEYIATTIQRFVNLGTGKDPIRLTEQATEATH